MDLWLPNPFLVASALLFGFTGWTFISMRKRVTEVHPKTRRPVRLAVHGHNLLWNATGGAIAPFGALMLGALFLVMGLR